MAKSGLVGRVREYSDFGKDDDSIGNESECIGCDTGSESLRYIFSP